MTGNLPSPCSPRRRALTPHLATPQRPVGVARSAVPWLGFFALLGGCYRFECEVREPGSCPSALSLSLKSPDLSPDTPPLYDTRRPLPLLLSAGPFLLTESFIRLEGSDPAAGRLFYNHLPPKGLSGEWQTEVALPDEAPCPQLRLRVHAGQLQGRSAASFQQSNTVELPIELSALRQGMPVAALGTGKVIHALHVDSRMPMLMPTIFAADLASPPASPPAAATGSLLADPDRLSANWTSVLQPEEQLVGVSSMAGAAVSYRNNTEPPLTCQTRGQVAVPGNLLFGALANWCYPAQRIVMAAPPSSGEDAAGRLVAIISQPKTSTSPTLRVAQVKGWPKSTVEPGQLGELSLPSPLSPAAGSVLSIGELRGEPGQATHLLLWAQDGDKTQPVLLQRSSADAMSRNNDLEKALRQGLANYATQPTAATMGRLQDKPVILLAQGSQLHALFLRGVPGMEVFRSCPLLTRIPGATPPENPALEDTSSDITALALVAASQPDSRAQLLVARQNKLSVYELYF